MSNQKSDPVYRYKIAKRFNTKYINPMEKKLKKYVLRLSKRSLYYSYGQENSELTTKNNYKNDSCYPLINKIILLVDKIKAYYQSRKKK